MKHVIVNARKELIICPIETRDANYEPYFPNEQALANYLMSYGGLKKGNPWQPALLP
jgi:hypothetical protein